MRKYSYLDLSSKAYDELLLLAQADVEHDASLVHKATLDVPLFHAYPGLIETIPYVGLGALPTPITSCTHAPETFGLNHLYIKRDDLSGREAYGGNKLRKLEFLLADALEYFDRQHAVPEARTVMTFGCVGSNHALATAIYAQKLGMNAMLMLKNEWNSHGVRNALLYDYASNARMFYADKNGLRAVSALYQMLNHKQEYGILPYVIPTGGSNGIGALGFVNAVFELKQQIAAGVMPEPDRIYVTAGSGGTMAGIVLGVKAAGLKSKVIGVMNEPEDVGETRTWIKKLASDTNELLISADPTFPHYALSDDDILLLSDYAGADYALFTQEALDVMKQLRNSEGIMLDGVYTGKAFTGLLDDVKKHQANKEVILFWNTYSSYDFSEIIKNIDYHQLAKPLHKFFEEDVQPLDKE
jgi:D-cysteine desulfhydrase